MSGEQVCEWRRIFSDTLDKMKFLLNFTVIRILSKIFLKIGIGLLLALLALSALPLLAIGYRHISDYDQAVWFYSEVIGLIAAPVIVLTLASIAQYYAVIFIQKSVASKVSGAIDKMKFWKRDKGKASKSKRAQRVKSPDVEAPKPGGVEKEANEQRDSGEPSRIRMPKVKLPNVKMPKVKLPKVKLPKVKLPKVKLPKIKVPDVKMPKIKVLDVKVPKIKTPFKKSGLGDYQDENARK